MAHELRWETRSVVPIRGGQGDDHLPIAGAAKTSRVVRIAHVRTEPGHPGECTLQDLLDDSRLRLELVAGDGSVGAARVLGAHAVELEDPSRWLGTGWMMLTTGARLRNKPQAQRDLVAELDDLGASCLGFGVGPSFKSVPVALLDEARRRNFPVVLVPETTQFRDVERVVYQSTHSMEASAYTRLSSLQQNLLRALSDPDPLNSVVRRLGRLTHSSVAVMSVDGEVMANVGSLPRAEIAVKLADLRSAGPTSLVIGDWHVVAAPVPVCGVVRQPWLVLASIGGEVAGALHGAALEVAVPLVDAVLKLSAARLEQERATRESLLDVVLDDGGSAEDTRTIAARIAAVGIGFGPAVRAFVVAERTKSNIRSVGPVLAEEVASWIHATLESVNKPYLLARRSDQVVVVMRGEQHMNSLINGIREKWSSATVGVGRSIEALPDVRASHRDAQLAVQHLAIRQDDAVLRYEDLDLVTQLLGEVPADRFEAKAAATVKLLEENPGQLEALRAYFAQNRDVKAAAESIHLHPNTLRYRLDRLEQALGRSLHEPAVTASLYCVLATMATAPAAIRPHL